jgi:3',5'-nucleoside bisphosphate phosphatase
VSQLHTIDSDGLWQPDVLLDYLAREGFRVVAITDHDHLDHTAELVTLGVARGVHVIPDVEMTTAWDGRMADLLCFAPACTSDALAAVARDTQRRQLENTRAVYQELLRGGYEFPRQRDTVPLHNGEPTRPIDNAALLVAHGHASSIAVALDMIRDAGYYSIQADLRATVAAAHASGALALIAHPGRRETGFTLYTPDLLDAVSATVPVDGIEVRYPLHTPAQVAEYERYARQRGWLQSAGSDSHARQQRLPIPYPAAAARELLERCGVHVVD